jgi:hypothetical protein
MGRQWSENEDGISMPICDNMPNVLIWVFMSSDFLPKLYVCVYYVGMHVRVVCVYLFVYLQA